MYLEVNTTFKRELYREMGVDYEPTIFTPEALKAWEEYAHSEGYASDQEMCEYCLAEVIEQENAVFKQLWEEIIDQVFLNPIWHEGEPPYPVNMPFDKEE